MEMETFRGGNYDGKLRAEAGLLIAPPLPPPIAQSSKDDKEKGLNLALGAGAEAYLHLLMQARADASHARDQIAALTGGKAVRPTEGRETIQPQFAGKTALSEMYESGGMGLEDLKGKLRRSSPIKKDTPEKSFGCYNTTSSEEDDENGSLSLSASSEGHAKPRHKEDTFKYTGASR